MSGLADIRDIFRGVVASLFGFGGRLIARALLMIIAGRAYGVEALGVLGQAAAITEIAAAIGVMGLKRSLLDLLSYDAERNENPEPRIVEALLAGLCLSVVISAGLVLVWRAILPDQPSVILLLFMAVPAIVFAEISLTAVRYKRIIGWDVFSRGVAEPWGFLVLAIFFFERGNTESGLLIAYVGSILIGAIGAGVGLLRTYGAQALVNARASLSRAATLPRRSAPAGITDVGVMALRRVDLVVLSIVANAESVGLYYMVQQLATVPQKVYPLFEPMLSPVIARLHNRLDAKKIRSNLIGVCRWVLIIQLAITVPMAVFGDSLLAIFGHAFAAGALVLAVILVAELVDGGFLAVETPLVFYKPRIPPKLLLFAIAIEVILIAAFASIWGAAGAAVGFLFAILVLAIGRLVMLKKYLGITVLNASYILPLLFAAIVFAALFAARRWIEPDQGAVVAIGIVGGVASFLFLIKTFALTASDRVLLRALAPK